MKGSKQQAQRPEGGNVMAGSGNKQQDLKDFMGFISKIMESVQ